VRQDALDDLAGDLAELIEVSQVFPGLAFEILSKLRIRAQNGNLDDTGFQGHAALLPIEINGPACYHPARSESILCAFRHDCCAIGHVRADGTVVH
jgi:hypothetical protein